MSGSVEPFNPFPPGTPEHAAYARQEARDPAPSVVALPPAEPGMRHELPNPKAPTEVARAVVDLMGQTDGVAHLAFWRDDFYTWRGTHWETRHRDAIRGWLYEQTEHAYYVEAANQLAWRPDKKSIDYLLDALKYGVTLRDPDVEAERSIALRNGVLQLDDRELLPHEPGRFNLNSLPFSYDADARCPKWLAFLESILPGDTEAQGLLAEWFGYVISGDTRQQKMLSIVGPPRCGKGTIGRILTEVLGAPSVSSPDLNTLGEPFGLESLIGKKLAIMSDVRWKGANVDTAVSHLLAIIGEDSRRIARKNRVDWHGRLEARFMAMSNDIPNFRDASGAMAHRMVHLKIDTSFLGKEDINLESRLMRELPGILNWALDGLDRLNKRGRFVTPESSRMIEQEVLMRASPHREFADLFCELDPGHTEGLGSLFDAWREWRRKKGQPEGGDERWLSMMLQNSLPGVRRTELRRTVDGRKQTILSGLKLTERPTGWLTPPKDPADT